MDARRRGFMLIELAVATFVVGVVLVALLALARTGQRAASDAMDEARASAFADEVFTTLRLFSARTAEDEDPNAWMVFWADLAHGAALTNLVGTTEGLWRRDSQEDLEHLAIYGDGQVRTNYWRPASIAEKPKSPVDADYALQYSLYLSTPVTNVGELSYSMTNNPPAAISATLHVWNGAFRSSASSYSFYAVFGYMGRLQP